MCACHAILLWDCDLVNKMPEREPVAFDMYNCHAGSQAEAGCICIDEHCGGSVHAGHVHLGGTLHAPPSHTSVSMHVCLCCHHRSESIITPAPHALPLCAWPYSAEAYLSSMCRHQSETADDLEFGDCADGALVRCRCAAKPS